MQAQCDICKTEKEDWDVTVQSDGVAWCSSCVNAHNQQLRDEAKQARKSAPRCSCCNRRGTWNVSGVLLCGTHKNKVQREYSNRTAKYGALMLAAPAPSSDTVLALAEGR